MRPPKMTPQRAEQHVQDIVARLEEAEARGYARGVEDAAKVADDYAAEKEEAAPSEDDADLSKRMLVYAKHVRRVASAIRALAKSTDGRGG